MIRRFDETKALQAAAALLNMHEGRQMDIIRLLKLLYIADREHLRRAGWPIVGHRWVAMKYGPLHSAVYNILDNRLRLQSASQGAIQRDGHSVQLAADPGMGKLSHAEIETLREVANHYVTVNDFDIVDETHQFPEYQKRYVEGTTSVITLDDVVDALDLSSDERRAIADQLAEALAVEQAELELRGA